MKLWTKCINIWNSLIDRDTFHISKIEVPNSLPDKVIDEWGKIRVGQRNISNSL